MHDLAIEKVDSPLAISIRALLHKSEDRQSMYRRAVFTYIRSCDDGATPREIERACDFPGSSDIEGHAALQDLIKSGIVRSTFSARGHEVYVLTDEARRFLTDSQQS